MRVESRKKALRYFFTPVVDALGYKFTPDLDMAEFLLGQEVEMERKLGSPFCPCQGRTQEWAENVKIICPCIPFHRQHFDYMKRCWCGLFVHKEVADPDSLPQIPYADFKRATAEWSEVRSPRSLASDGPSLKSSAYAVGRHVGPAPIMNAVDPS